MAALADGVLTIQAKPSQPGKPECNKIDNTSIEITWSAPADDGGDQVTRYVIQQHHEGSNEDWVTKEEQCHRTTHTLPDMDPGNYQFRVLAENSAGKSEPSEPSENITIFAKPSPPGKPECNKIDNTSIEITWSAPADDGGDQVTGYVIQQHHEESSEDWVTKEEQCPRTTHKISDMDPGKYRFRVLAENSAGKSEPSEPSENITIFAKPSPPGKPECKKIDNTSIEITWSAPADDGGDQVTGYVLQQHHEESSEDWVTKEEQCPRTTHKISDMDPGKYRFRVLAENSAGKSEPSEPSENITIFAKPSPPGKPECKKIDNTSIEITWSAPADDGGDQVTYVIQQHHEESSEDWVTKEEQCCNTTHTIHDMDPGNYQFCIFAENSAGKSEPSEASDNITIFAPLEIQLRGPEALAAYQEALKEGKEEIHCIRLMLVGQERVGKTSLVKAFMGQKFNQREEITDGVDASNACSVPFSEPNNWKPLKRNRDEHIKQLDEQHNYGVGLAAARKLDPELEREDQDLTTHVGETQPQPSEYPPNQDEQATEILETLEKAPEAVDDPDITLNIPLAAASDDHPTEIMEVNKVWEPVGDMAIASDIQSIQSDTSSDDQLIEIPETVNQGQKPAHDLEIALETQSNSSSDDQLTEIPDTVEQASKPAHDLGNAVETQSNSSADDQLTEIPEAVKQAKKPAGAEDLEVIFWDFAGQDLYYTTHQVFFNRRAVFALVFDMSKELGDQCQVQDFSETKQKQKKTRRFDNFSGEDFLKFWLQSIYTYAVQNSAIDTEGYPPIFIIGTHRKDSPTEIEDVEDQIFEIIEGKPYEKYVKRQFHFLENNPDKKEESDNEKLNSFKKAIAETAMNAPHMKEKYPIKWLKFHKAVLEEVHNGRHFMKLKEVEVIAASCNILVTDESHEFTTMLNLYHDLGAIIWFGDHGHSLKNIVILDPQWLVDVFKAVITVKPRNQQDPHFSPLWRELKEQGILREQLIDHVWEEWNDIKGELLEIMEKFDLLVKNLPKNEDEKDRDGEPNDKQSLEYCVPACLQPVDKSEDENIMDGTFYVDFDNFLPDGFFHRVLVYFSRWSSAHTGEPFSLYYRKCESVVGRAENLHECSLLMVPSSTQSHSASIKVVVKRVGEHGTDEPTQTVSDPEVCTRVFGFIAKTLHELRDKWAKGITYQMKVCCVACRDAGREKLHLIPVEKCKGAQPFYCSQMKKTIAAKKLYWNADETDSLSTSDKLSKSASQNKQDSPSSSDKLSSSELADQKMQGQHIMISYCWGDKARGFPCQQRMMQLRDELEEAGFSIWLDVEDMRGNMDDRMAEAVDGAFVILLCYSKEYQRSKSCKKEAQYASYKNKPIIPLKFDGHKPDGWLGLIICNLIYHEVRSEEAMKKNLPAIIKDIEDSLSPVQLHISAKLKDQKHDTYVRCPELDRIIQDIEGCKDSLTVVQKILTASGVILTQLEPAQVINICRRLQSKASISRDDNERINLPMHTTSDKVDRLLEILCRKPVNSYYQFMDALFNEHGDLYTQMLKTHSAKIDKTRSQKVEAAGKPDYPDKPTAEIRKKKIRSAKDIQFLIKRGVLQETPEDIAQFLFQGEGHNKTVIGDYLGQRNDFNIKVLEAFVALFEFKDMNLVQALRQFLWSFRLPGVAQKIDRIMECFAKRYCESNSGIFESTDTCYVLSFAIIMLNTSLHNPSVRDKPSLERFVQMNRGINEGRDLPEELLKSLYDSIKKEPFKIPEDDGNDLTRTFFNPDKEGWLMKQGSSIYRNWKRRWFILTDNCLYYFEFTTDKEPRGIIPLENLQIREVDDKGRLHCFELYTSSGREIKAAKKQTSGKIVEGKHTIYRMQAANQEEKENWIKAITASIAKDPFYEMLAARKKKATGNN